VIKLTTDPHAYDSASYLGVPKGNVESDEDVEFDIKDGLRGRLRDSLDSSVAGGSSSKGDGTGRLSGTGLYLPSS
jgi:hypothetical protein